MWQGLIIFLLVMAPGAAAQVRVEPQKAPPQLLADLKSDNPETRRKAADQIGGMRARDAVPQLIAALSDKEAAVREAAAFALGQITDRAATPALLRALRDADREVRASAAFALGMLGDPKTAEALSDALNDEATAVRASAVTALGLMQDREAVDELIEMLGDSSFDARYDAAWALGQIGEPDAADHLRATLAELDAWRVPEPMREAFRQTAQNAIENLASRSSSAAAETRPRRATGAVEPNPYQQGSLPARVRQSVRPAPTERAMRARVNGAVALKVLVGGDGRPVRAYVTRRLGYGLDQRAVQAAMQYRFDAAMKAGLPQAEWVNLEVKF